MPPPALPVPAPKVVRYKPLPLPAHIQPADFKRFAEITGFHERFIYQCCTGRREMAPSSAAGAVRMLREFGYEVHVWDFCRHNWMRWRPDLIGAEGAPAISGVPPIPAASEGRSA